MPTVTGTTALPIRVDLEATARSAGEIFGSFLQENHLSVPAGPQLGASPFAPPSILNPGYAAMAFNGTEATARSMAGLFGAQSEALSRLGRSTPFAPGLELAAAGPAAGRAFWLGVLSALKS